MQNLKLKMFAVIAALPAMGAASPVSAADNYLLDASHTTVMFGISHLGFSRALGRFDTVEGAFALDAGAPEKSSVAVTIDAASLDTNHEERDEHLRGKDFFDVAQFPKLIYKSTAVKVTGEKTATVTGELTMHGVTKLVPLEVTLVKTGPHPRDASMIVAGFSARGTLKRSDFGMSYGLPVLGDEVEIIIEAETIKQP